MLTKTMLKLNSRLITSKDFRSTMQQLLIPSLTRSVNFWSEDIFKIHISVIVHNITFKISAVVSEKCQTGLSSQQGQIDTLKSSIKMVSDDLFEMQTDDSQLDEITDTISSMNSKVRDFEHKQDSLTNYVNNFKQDVEISIAGYLTHFTQYIGKKLNYKLKYNII